MNDNIIIRANGIRVEYPNVVANDNVDFELLHGEIHGLLGENGAGKTTLVNVIYGIKRPDSGELYIFGDKITSFSPKVAQRYGLYMIPQHSILVERHTVLENIALALPGFKLNKKALRAKVMRLINRLRLELDLDSKVMDLSVGEKQRVEAIRALVRGAKVLIMDEPTSVLSPMETYSLFSFIRNLKKEGLSVIFITHRLREVMELCDRVTVLRKGRNMGTLTREEMTIDKLTELMFSRKIMIRRYNNRSMQGKVILSLKNVSTFSNGGYIGLKDISLDIRVGEIVGIVGVAGNGQNELAQVAVGLIKPHSGRIIIDGDDLTGKSIFEFYKKGLAYIPDNILDGLVLDMTLTENAILKLYRTSGFSMNHIVDWETAKRYTSEIVKNLEIKTPSIDVKIKSLSGGNLQRFILSRELSNNPKIIIAVHPSRGLDLESTAKVLGYLAKMKSHSGILLITEDLDEAIKICDKIMIIYKGKLSKPMNIDNLDYELAGKMMSGAVSIEEAN